MSSGDGEAGLFFVGIMLSAIIAAFIPDRAIPADQIERANNRCDKNGGMSEMRAGYFDRSRVWCKDGAEFTIPYNLNYQDQQ